MGREYVKPNASISPSFLGEILPLWCNYNVSLKRFLCGNITLIGCKFILLGFVTSYTTENLNSLTFGTYIRPPGLKGPRGWNCCCMMAPRARGQSWGTIARTEGIVSCAEGNENSIGPKAVRVYCLLLLGQRRSVELVEIPIWIHTVSTLTALPG